MGTGECKVAKQSGQKGYFGRVVSTPSQRTTARSPSNSTNIAPIVGSRGSIGIDYALEHISRRAVYPKGLRIRVTAIEGHDVDTTTSLIAYITAHAMFQALGVEEAGKKPSVDFEKGLVEFAK